MTFSEKLKEARKNSGYSQEQLAEKICVSRQAVTKWETGKGMPDIENLKAISSLLNVSIDYLLDDESNEISNEIKEKICLDDYKEKPEGARNTSDACVMAKFPKAERIFSLTRTKKMGKLEWVLDFIGENGLFVMNSLRDWGQSYYLVKQSDKQYFVCVDSEFITSNVLGKSYEGKKFQRGSYIYKKLYALK